MEVTINYNGQAVAVEVTLEVYEFLDRADHKTENLFHEQRRHWDGREFDEYIITTEGVGGYGETPEEYLCRMETLHELMTVLDTCTAVSYTHLVCQCPYFQHQGRGPGGRSVLDEGGNAFVLRPAGLHHF